MIIGDNLTVDEQGKVNLPVATATTLGGVKVGNGLAITADGTLSAYDNVIEVGLSAYPVGSIYQSTDATSPAALFGGSWEEIASERVLMGASRTHAAGTTVEAGLPNIKFSFTAITVGTGFRGTEYRTDGVSSSDFNLDASKSNAIYGRSSTVQPAAYYVHIWHRVA